MSRIQDYLNKYKESSYKQNRCNVGIFPEQHKKIKKLVKKGKYNSINEFVISAVEDKLSKCNNN